MRKAVSRAVRAFGLGAITALAGACLDVGYDLADPESFEEYADEEAGGGAATLEGCEEGSVPPSDEGPQISFLSGNAVDREVLTIKIGDIVTFTNTDMEQHTATAGAPGAEIPEERGGFDSGRFGTGGKWAFRFCSARTVIWFCETHPANMNNYRIIIEE